VVIEVDDRPVDRHATLLPARRITGAEPQIRKARMQDARVDASAAEDAAPGRCRVDVPNDVLIEMYRRMVRIRLFEQTVTDLALKGQIAGSAHTSIGQEGEIVGACMALRTDDYMIGNHRSHGHPIGKGAELKPLMAELHGKVTGVCKGKGGSMHLADFSVGSLGETSIVGSGLPITTGAALGAKMQGTDRVALCFFGDGASNEGSFHEAINMAAIWDLPAIFLCENNGYGATTSAREVLSVGDVAARAAGYDIPGAVVDGQDAIAVYEVVTAAVARARRGDGPSLIEAKTYRYDNHAVGLHVTSYRTEDEIGQWKDRDPLVIHRTLLLDEGVLTEADAEAIVAETEQAVQDALDFARASAYPEPEAAFEDVFTNPIPIPR
jgi:pyruvate dehydrogenase E1 component alpha subunit